MRTGTANELIVWLRNQPADKRYQLKEYRSKRTLTQNAYYHALLTEVADKMRMKKPEAHNRMLRDYGRIWLIDGREIEQWIPENEESEKSMLANEYLHFKPTDEIKIFDCVIHRKWVMLLPTHLMTTEEMSILIDGLVQEAQALDIETLTWRELQEMREHEI